MAQTTPILTNAEGRKLLKQLGKDGKLMKGLTQEYKQKIVEPLLKLKDERGIVTVRIKPMSVNRAWQGQRFKTKEYSQYAKILISKLPNIKIPEPPLEVHYVFGMSNILSDWDNPIKPFQDILQERYGFNDKHILKAVVEKRKVAKEDEFIRFSIKHLQDSI